MPKKLRHFLQRAKIQCRTNNYVGANIARPLFHNIAVIYDIAVTHNIVVCDFVIICNITIPMLNKTAHKEKIGRTMFAPTGLYLYTVI